MRRAMLANAKRRTEEIRHRGAGSAAADAAASAQASAAWLDGREAGSTGLDGQAGRRPLPIAYGSADVLHPASWGQHRWGKTPAAAPLTMQARPFELISWRDLRRWAARIVGGDARIETHA